MYDITQMQTQRQHKQTQSQLQLEGITLGDNAVDNLIPRAW